MCNGQITQTLDFGPIEHMDQRVFSALVPGGSGALACAGFRAAPVFSRYIMPRER